MFRLTFLFSNGGNSCMYFTTQLYHFLFNATAIGLLLFFCFCFVYITNNTMVNILTSSLCNICNF